VFRPTPKRSPDEALRLSCPHCDKSIEANRVSPLVVAGWICQAFSSQNSG